MMGEIAYQNELNAITSRIVEACVALWRENPGAMIVCEARLLSDYALQLGVTEGHLMTAIPAARGHRTRKVAEWIRHHRPPAWKNISVITHALHAGRAERIFNRCQIRATFVGLDLPFSPDDPDWKLRSSAVFRAYDRMAGLYCRARGWV
jgi:hypothetical protein